MSDILKVFVVFVVFVRFVVGISSSFGEKTYYATFSTPPANQQHSAFARSATLQDTLSEKRCREDERFG
jgi:hypothetical protein